MPRCRVWAVAVCVAALMGLSPALGYSYIAADRDTRTWEGDGVRITFSVPENYAACFKTSHQDEISLTGLPAGWRLGNGDTEIQMSYVVGETRIDVPNGIYNIDYVSPGPEIPFTYTVTYPPAPEWPQNTDEFGTRQLYVGVAIVVMDEGGNPIPWIGGDPERAPGTVGPNGQDWTVWCREVVIGGRVWEDDNADGLQDTTSDGIAGVQTQLLDIYDNLIATQVTDARGAYLFPQLVPGTYQVKVVVPEGYHVSPQVQGHDITLNSDLDAQTGRIAAETTDSANLHWDAGLYRLASLGGRTWQDHNQDGIRSLDEDSSGVANIALQIYQVQPGEPCSDAPAQAVSSTFTDAAGDYSFGDLAPGHYCVRASLPEDMAYTLYRQGSDPARDSDLNPITGWMELDLVSGSQDQGCDIGLVRSAQSGGVYLPLLRTP